TGYDKFEYARESLKLGAVDVILKPIRNSDLESTLTQIYNQLGEKKTVSSEAVSGVGANPAPDKTGETMGHLTRAVVNYIDQNYAAEISLGALAEMYRVTPSHLSKVFKKEKGLTFLRYLNQIRMDHASQMLLDPKYRISEIAESCGFHSPLQFTKVFKEFYGKTPRDFRRR
ncbi:MAG: DNA-binding response regulator, partial [Spirochaetales bacterium]|nr:DNA-binding response regulator [Spirochaetales bacterium]